SGDVTMVEDGDWRQARTRVAAAVEILRGLELRASAEDHRSLKLGITVRSPHGSGSAAEARADDRRAYESYAFSAHAGEDRALVVPRAAQRVALVRVSGTLADEPLAG